MEPFRISGKDLGALAMPDFCPRCFWIQRNAPLGLPYQIFPGIFSSIDSYTKKVVHSWFDRHKSSPTWLAKIPDVISYLEPPHYSKFSFVDEKSGMTLRGSPDAVFCLRDGSLMIADYKTARFTKHQDKLMPVYQTQLNAYAVIAHRIAYGKVTKLGLIYTEPVTDDGTANNDAVHNSQGFSMAFAANILDVPLEAATIPPLLQRAREIVESPKPPKGNVACKECEKLNEIAGLIANAPAV